MDRSGSSQQVHQLQSSLRMVFQKLNEERGRNEILEDKIEDLKMKIKAQSLFKQEMSSLQKKVKKLTNENKFLRIRLEVQKRTKKDREIPKKEDMDNNRQDLPSCPRKILKAASLSRMNRFNPFGRRDSFSVMEEDKPNPFEERIRKKRIRIKCKELVGRINLIRIGLGNMKGEMEKFKSKVNKSVESFTDKTILFSSNIFLPKVANAQDSQTTQIRFLEKEIQHWKKKLQKTEWRFAVKQQKMIYQFGMIDFYNDKRD